MNWPGRESQATGLGNITFEVADITAGLTGIPPADLVYCRFVLTHLQAPELALARLVEHVLPGGVAVLEDIEISGGVIHPPSAAHQAFTDLYRRAALGRGVDPDIGPRLPAMLRAAGIADVQTCVVQPAGLQGEVKHVDYLTMDAIADAVVEDRIGRPLPGRRDHRRIGPPGQRSDNLDVECADRPGVGHQARTMTQRSFRLAAALHRGGC